MEYNIERMKKSTFETGLVGLGEEVIKTFLEQHSAELENKELPLDGEWGEKGVHVIKCDQIDPKGRKAIITIVEFNGKKFAVFYK
jgi:hypothetical protein